MSRQQMQEKLNRLYLELHRENDLDRCGELEDEIAGIEDCLAEAAHAAAHIEDSPSLAPHPFDGVSYPDGY